MIGSHRTVARVLHAAGIEINGKNPWDIRVHDERFFKRVLVHGSLGLGEAYMEGWWDAERVDLFIERVLRSGKIASDVTLPLLGLRVKSFLSNLQSRRGAKKVIHEHYDFSNDFYASFLDPHMQYSCAYFKDTDDLAEAQLKKMELVCKKLHLKKGDRVLDIGCGWGGLVKYIATTYGCSVVGITLSEKQAAYARASVQGLPVEIKVSDYRDVHDGSFDKIVSVGMFEHVGVKNYPTFFKSVDRLLAPHGLFLLHTIGQNITYSVGEPWVEKYIFPGGQLPSPQHIAKHSEGLFVLEDWHNFGPYYHQTLRAWDERFQKNRAEIEVAHSPRFYRMFRYYFNSFAGSFKARRIQLWQIVFTKGADDVVYPSVR